MTQSGHHWADEIVPLNADITNCNYLLSPYCTAAFANYIRASNDRIGAPKGGSAGCDLRDIRPASRRRASGSPQQETPKG